MSSLDKTLPRPSIELYSGKYFAACGLGGIIGMSDSFSRSIGIEVSAFQKTPYLSIRPIMLCYPFLSILASKF
jgi:hypothetical protein